MGTRSTWWRAWQRAFRPGLALAILAGVGGAEAAPAGSRFNADYFTNLPVTTHEGRTVPFYDGLIKGKIVVLNFIYLNCNDICPLSTSRVAQIKERLGDAVGRDIFIYSITMDPDRDTPALLKEYADAFGAGNGWEFVTGSPEDMKRIRWQVGERSRTLTEHRNDMMLGNDITGEWSRSSIYADLDVSVSNIRELDPVWRATPRTVSSVAADPETYRMDRTPGQALFMKACATCHSIGGGDFVGPDLADIGTRRERDWLTRFLMSPERMRNAKDPLTLELSAKYKGVVMPNLGLKENDVADVLQYIEARSQAAKSAAPGAAANPKAPGG